MSEQNRVGLSSWPQSWIVFFLLLQCLVLIVVIAIQYVQLSGLKKKIMSLQNRLSRILEQRNAYGFPVTDRAAYEGGEGE